MKKIFFVRHGESENNQKKIYTGTIDATLTDLGRQQARETGELLRDKNITHIITSDLVRAYDTALNIKSIIDDSDTIKVEKTSLLRTNYLGEIQGTPYVSSGLIYALENKVGETAQSIYDRIMEALQLIRSTDTEGNILVVGHGALIGLMFGVHDGKFKDDFITIRKAWSFKNGEVKEKDI